MNEQASIEPRTPRAAVPGGVDGSSHWDFRYVDDGAHLLRGPNLRPEVMLDFRRHFASPLMALFGGALFDQVAILPIAASVDATGRFADNFTDRGIRSFFSAFGILGGPEHRKQSAQWLKHMHREVHGVGKGDFDGVRYSALEPESWLWIAVSSLRLLVVTFPVCTGRRPTEDEQEAIYQFVRYILSDLELPSSRGRFPESWREFVEYYDNVIEDKAQSNVFLRENFAALKRLPLPTLILPRWLRPLVAPGWVLSRGAIGHLTRLCSAQVMHPLLPPAAGYELKRRHDIEFRLIRAVLSLTWRAVPARLLTEPLTYERLQLEAMEWAGDTGAEYDRRRRRFEERLDRAMNFAERFKLDSFAVPESRSGCPV